MNKALWILFFLGFVSLGVFARNSAVTGIDLNQTNDKLLIGDSYNLRVSISNDANEALSSILSVYDQGTTIFTLGYQISALSTIDVNVPYYTTQDGNHVLLASIDINDDNLADNNLSKTFFFKKGIDVTSTGVFFPLLQSENQDVNAQIFITNQGDVDAWFFYATMFLDNNQIGIVQIPPLKPNEYFQFSTNFVSGSQGRHVFRLELDLNQTLKEFLRSNNQAIIGFQTQQFVDGNLTRADIEQIIQDFFDRTKTDLQNQLSFCNQMKDTVTLDYNACVLQRENYLNVGADFQSKYNSCQGQLDSKTQSLSLADSSCDQKLLNQSSTDSISCKAQLDSKAGEVTSKDGELNSANNLLLILGGLFVITALGISAFIWKNGGLK